MHLLKFHLETKTLTEISPGEFAAEPGCRYFYVQGKHAAVPVLTRDGIGEIVWQHPDYQPPLPANDVTEQHRATPEQWAVTESRGVGDYATSSCLLELRDRVQLLETHIAAIEPLSARIQAATGSALHLATVTSKLGHRVEALESTQHAHIDTSPARDEQREAAAAFHRMLALQDQIRDGVLTLAEAVKEIDNAPAPDLAADAQQLTLVERVAYAIETEDGPIPAHGPAWAPEARAAIRVVAEWLRAGALSDWGLAAAYLLDDEAKR